MYVFVRGVSVSVSVIRYHTVNMELMIRYVIYVILSVTQDLFVICNEI